MTPPTFSLTSATASQVIKPLMVAVFNAGGKPLDASNVHWNSVLSHFAILTGVDMESFGNDTRGYPRLKTAISGAWGNAKKQGWATKSPRRTYCLSEDGIKQAILIAAAASIVVEQANPAPTATVVEPEPTFIAKVVVVEPKGTVGVSWNNPSGTPSATHNTYDGDAYFRSLAASNTRCFGKWSSKANACKECPLATLCYGTQIAQLAEIAHALNVEWEEKVAAPTAAPTPVPTPVPTQPPTPTLPEGAKLMPVAFETVCTSCGKVCPEGVEAVHIPGLGVFHSTCATTLK